MSADHTQLTHKQAVNRMKDINEEIDRLGARDSLSVEDEQHWTDLVREFEELDDHRKRLEREADRARVKAVLDSPERGKVEHGTPLNSTDGYDTDPILNPDSVEDKRFRNPWDLTEVRTFSRSKGEIGQELRARALSAVEKMGGASDKVRQAGTDIIERWDDERGSIAQLCLATSSPEYLRAWSKTARGNAHMVTPDEQRALERAMSLTDAQGGYLVPFQLDPTVIITSDGSLNQIRRVARQVVATGDVWNGVSAGQVQWAWAGEGTEATDDSPAFEQPNVPVHKAHGFVPISIEALADEANVTAEVGRLLAFGKDSLESEAFIHGSGSGQPTGLVTALSGGSGEVTSETADSIAAADIYALDDALPARYRGNASWLGNRTTYNAVRALGTGGGSDMWERIGAGMPPLLLGRSAFEAEEMDSPGTTADGDVPQDGSDHVLAYGDFSNYVIADRVGMTVELVPHLFGSNNRFPTGQRGWYAYYRVGADSVNNSGFRVLLA